MLPRGIAMVTMATDFKNMKIVHPRNSEHIGEELEWLAQKVLKFYSFDYPKTPFWENRACCYC